jgi:hypothetical protein
MDPDGNLTVLITGLGLVKMDWDSRVIWISRPSDNAYLKGVRPGYHHDFDMTGSGDIYVLARELRRIDPGGRKLPKRIRGQGSFSRGREICDNSVATLSADGVVKGNISLYDLVGESMSAAIQAYADEYERRSRERGTLKVCSDIFHANTVEEIRRDIAVAGRGDILFCIRNLDLIGIFRPETGRLLWSWGPGVLEFPHQPSVLANGHILVFDNGRRERAYSRILELDPGTSEIVWRYQGTPPESFFSAVMGGSQRLPNGNTLITESTTGRVFEVTRDGATVWQFLNFEVSSKGEGKGKRATIYRMIRYGPRYLQRPVAGHPAGS